MNYWLHRISHCAEVSYPLLEKGYLSIGWSDFSEPDFIINSCKENGGEFFDERFKQDDEVLPRSRYSLWYYITEMTKGDRVIVPSSGTFSIYEIDEYKVLSIPELIDRKLDIEDWSGNKVKINKDGYLCIGKDIIDLGFFWKVKPIAIEISRYEYADSALTARMKVRQTTADITDLANNVEKALIAFGKEKPLNIYSQIVEKASQQILDTIRTELDPDKFEYLVKWYFQRIGASDVYIPSKNESGKEGDADVVATFEAIKTIIYTQAKFHRGTTDDLSVDQIKNYKEQKEAIDDGYSKISWVISSADDFSQEAQNNAKEAKVQLIDGKQFTTMLLEAGIGNLDKAI